MLHLHQFQERLMCVRNSRALVTERTEITSSQYFPKPLPGIVWIFPVVNKYLQFVWCLLFSDLHSTHLFKESIAHQKINTALDSSFYMRIRAIPTS